MTSVNSAAFDVTPGQPDRIEFASQPGGGVAATAWSLDNLPVVAVVDAAGNPTPGSGAQVALKIAGGLPTPILGLATPTVSLDDTGVSAADAFAGLYINDAGTFTFTTVTSGLASVDEAFSGLF